MDNYNKSIIFALIGIVCMILAQFGWYFVLIEIVCAVLFIYYGFFK